MLAPFRPTPRSRSHAVPQEIQFLLGHLPGFSAPEKSTPRNAENPDALNSFLWWDHWLWVAEHLAKHRQLRTWSDPTEPRAVSGPRASPATKKLQPLGGCPARGPNPGRSGLPRASGSGIPIPLHAGDVQGPQPSRLFGATRCRAGGHAARGQQARSRAGLQSRALCVRVRLLPSAQCGRSDRCDIT